MGSFTKTTFEVVDQREITPDNSIAVPNDLFEKYLPLFKGEQFNAVVDLIKQAYEAGLEVGRSESSLFVVIPVEILQSRDLSKLAKILYGGIIALSRKSGFCYATNKYLAQTVGVAEKSINRPLRELAEKGKIKIEVKRDKSGTRRFIYPIFTCGESSESKEGVLKRTRGGFSKEQGQKINKQIINKQNNNTPPIYSPPKKPSSKKFSSLKDITPEVIQEIANSYKVSVGFVNLQFERLRNYCESRGRVYKNYKAALRNFVLGEMQRVVERRQIFKKGGFVDASEN